MLINLDPNYTWDGNLYHCNHCGVRTYNKSNHDLMCPFESNVVQLDLFDVSLFNATV